MRPYYDQGGVAIYHGDCRDVLQSLSDSSIDLVLTDPPYGHNNNDGDLNGWLNVPFAGGGGQRTIANDGQEADALVRWTMSEARRLLPPGACAAYCCPGGGGRNPTFARWALWLDEVMEFKQALIWDKGGLGLGWHYRRNYEFILVAQRPGAACRWYGGGRQSNVIRLPRDKAASTDHPTPKPTTLMGTIVRCHTKPGDLVLDPFCGTGSTLVAAQQLGRRAIGVELEEQYCEIAAKRLAQMPLPLDIKSEGRAA